MTPFKCTKCGGEDVQYIEDISSGRRLLGIDKQGSLNIANTYTTEGFDEHPTNRRLVCSCGHEMPLPGKLDFV